MGILAEPLAYLRKLNLPSGFAVCELGDQFVTGEAPRRPAVEFYKEIGCGRYEAVDGNGRGTILADLNLPLSKRYHQCFELVTDFGTGEHVFDQRQVWTTIHHLCRPGGVIAFDRPTAGYPGHGFYLVDECLLRDLAAANNYKILWMERTTTTRGELLRGAFQRGHKNKFRAPQQGRYKKLLRPITGEPAKVKKQR